MIVYIKAPYHHRLCIVASNQVERESKDRKQSLESIRVYVYINDEIIHSSSANAVFRSNKTKSILLNPTMTLPDIIIAIQSTIGDDNVTLIITTLWYHCPVYQFNGHFEYRTIQIIDEEGVWCMFDTLANMESVICLELKVDVHNSSSLSQVNDLSWAEMEHKLDNSLKLE